MRRLTGRLLLVLLLALTGWAAYAQFHSVIARTLAQRQDKTVYIAVLTQPAMTFSYNPATHKSVLTTVKRRKTPKDLADNAADLFLPAGASSRIPSSSGSPTISSRRNFCFWLWK